MSETCGPLALGDRAGSHTEAVASATTPASAKQNATVMSDNLALKNNSLVIYKNWVGLDLTSFFVLDVLWRNLLTAF